MIESNLGSNVNTHSNILPLLYTGSKTILDLRAAIAAKPTGTTLTTQQISNINKVNDGTSFIANYGWIRVESNTGGVLVNSSQGKLLLDKTSETILDLQARPTLTTSQLKNINDINTSAKLNNYASIKFENSGGSSTMTSTDNYNFLYKNSKTILDINGELAKKQLKLTAGTGITIDSNNQISAITTISGITQAELDKNLSPLKINIQSNRTTINNLYTNKQIDDKFASHKSELRINWLQGKDFTDNNTLNRLATNHIGTDVIQINFINKDKVFGHIQKNVPQLGTNQPYLEMDGSWYKNDGSVVTGIFKIEFDGVKTTLFESVNKKDVENMKVDVEKAKAFLNKTYIKKDNQPHKLDVLDENLASESYVEESIKDKTSKSDVAGAITTSETKLTSIISNKQDKLTTKQINDINNIDNKQTKLTTKQINDINEIDTKQDNLTAGTGITIVNNTISSSVGGGTTLTTEQLKQLNLLGKKQKLSNYSLIKVENEYGLENEVSTDSIKGLTDLSKTIVDIRKRIKDNETEKTQAITNINFINKRKLIITDGGAVKNEEDLKGLNESYDVDLIAPSEKRVNTKITNSENTLKALINNKQDPLIAGTNITINGNTISASGTGGGATPDLTPYLEKSWINYEDDKGVSQKIIFPMTFLRRTSKFIQDIITKISVIGNTNFVANYGKIITQAVDGSLAYTRADYQVIITTGSKIIADLEKGVKDNKDNVEKKQDKLTPKQILDINKIDDGNTILKNYGIIYKEGVNGSKEITNTKDELYLTPSSKTINDLKTAIAAKGTDVDWNNLPDPALKKIKQVAVNADRELIVFNGTSTNATADESRGVNDDKRMVNLQGLKTYAFKKPVGTPTKGQVAVADGTGESNWETLKSTGSGGWNGDYEVIFKHIIKDNKIVANLKGTDKWIKTGDILQISAGNETIIENIETVIINESNDYYNYNTSFFSNTKNYYFTFNDGSYHAILQNYDFKTAFKSITIKLHRKKESK